MAQLGKRFKPEFGAPRGLAAGFGIALEPSKLQKDGEKPEKGHFYFLRQTLVCTKSWFERDKWPNRYSNPVALQQSCRTAFVFSLSLPLAITASGGLEGNIFSLAIIAFGAFQFIVPEYYCRLGKMEFKESSLFKEVTVFKLPLGRRRATGGCRSHAVACRAAVGHFRIRIRSNSGPNQALGRGSRGGSGCGSRQALTLKHPDSHCFLCRDAPEQFQSRNLFKLFRSHSGLLG